MTLLGVNLDFPEDMAQTSLPYVGSELFLFGSWMLPNVGTWLTPRRLRINKSGSAAVEPIGYRYNPVLLKLVTVSGYQYPFFQSDNVPLEA